MSLDELRMQQTRRQNLRTLAWACAAAIALTLLATTGPADITVAGASGQTFEDWYAQPENRDWYHFNEWYGASPRNSSYFHIRQHFGNGPTGDKAVQIAICESDLNPRAVSRTNDHGVMQLNAPSWRSRFAQVTGHAWDPNVYHASLNVAFAKWLFDETGGFSHWACA